MRKLTLIGAAIAALLATGLAPAGGSEVVASASGGYGFSGVAAGSNFDVGPFTFNVQVHADGSVHGRYNYTQVRDGGTPLTVKGSLTCAVIVGNRAIVGGIIEEASRPALVGLDMWFQVEDNGEGANDPPDMSSSIGAGGPGTAQQYCDDAPGVRFPFFLDRGNLQVRS